MRGKKYHGWARAGFTSQILRDAWKHCHADSRNGRGEWEAAGPICTDVQRRQMILGIREEVCRGILPRRAFVNVPRLQGIVKFYRGIRGEREGDSPHNNGLRAQGPRPETSLIGE